MPPDGAVRLNPVPRVDKAALKASKHVGKEINTDSRDIDKAVREAATEVS